MTKIELLKLIKNAAISYSEIANTSIHNNNHMNNIATNIKIEQNIIDAILVDFINYIGVKQGIDYAMYTSDLHRERE